MSAFEDYLKSRKEQFEKTAGQFKEDEKKEYTADERLWYPSGDEKTGSGSAVIRFLPPKLDSKAPYSFVKLFQHGFQGPTGSWFVERCPTTMGWDHPCPVCESNKELWNSGLESDKKIASEHKRKLQYYSNVYIINDANNPENNGRTVIYRYGKVVYNMLHDKMNPSFDDIPRVDPFDILEGCTLRLRFKIDKSSGFRTYSASEFDQPAPLFDDNEKLEKVYNSMHDLFEFADPASFKTHGELLERMKSVVGNNPRGAVPKPVAREEEIEVESVDDLAALDNVETEDFDAFFEGLK